MGMLKGAQKYTKQPDLNVSNYPRVNKNQSVTCNGNEMGCLK